MGNVDKLKITNWKVLSTSDKITRAGDQESFILILIIQFKNLAHFRPILQFMPSLLLFWWPQPHLSFYVITVQGLTAGDDGRELNDIYDI